MSYNQTIDLDTNDIHIYIRYMMKLLTCKHRLQRPFIKKELSCSTNGYHFQYGCELENCHCRFTMDDQRRVNCDAARPTFMRNVLFSSKSLVINGRRVVTLSK